MSSLQLYALTAQFKELERLADEDIPEEAIRDTLEGLQGEIQLKAVNVVSFARSLEVFRDAVEANAKAMKERAARLDRRIASLHDYVLHNMQACGISKIESPDFTLSVQKNPPAVIVDIEDQIPERFMVTPPPAPPPAPRPDKKALCDALKRGEAVPGCHLEQGQRLRVKV